MVAYSIMYSRDVYSREDKQHNYMYRLNTRIQQQGGKGVETEGDLMTYIIRAVNRGRIKTN